MSDKTTGWEGFYRKNLDTSRYIAHENAEAMNQLFQAAMVQKILDLGCGDGRHLKYFANQGYKMYGLDISPTALRMAEEWLAEDGLSAEFACNDMTDIPWPNDFFEALVCVQVINHHYVEGIRKTFHEIYRVLKPGGWFFLSVQTGNPPDPNKDPSIKIVAPNTCMYVDDKEIGVPHYFFTQPALLEELSKFTLETGPWLDKREKTCLLLRKPST